MRLQWLRHTKEVIIFLDYYCQSSLSCSEKSSVSKKKIHRKPRFFPWFDIQICDINPLLMACKQLSEFEKDQIMAYNDCGLSLHNIAKKFTIIHQLVFSLKKFQEN